MEIVAGTSLPHFSNGRQSGWFLCYNYNGDVVRVLKDISSMVVIFLFISNRLVTSTFGIWKIPRNDFIPEKQGSSKDRTLLPETDYG